MKRCFYVLSSLLLICMLGCSKSSKIEYVPCKIEKGEDWSFIDSKGNVYCREAFKHRPSFVRNGVFTVEDETGSCLYKFDKKKPILILEDLKYVGKMNGGLMPICKENEQIEIINAQGETQFKLTRINGIPITSCSMEFIGDYLIVKDANNNMGVVNRHGRYVLAPTYDFIYPIRKNLFVCQNDEDETFIINEHGEELDIWDKEELKQVAFQFLKDNLQNEHFVLVGDDKIQIYNLRGELVLKCPKRVKEILSVHGEHFVFKSEDGCGVMDMNGERIINDKYESIVAFRQGYIARRDKDHDFEYLNKHGELETKIPDLSNIRVIDGFDVVVGVDKDDEYLLDDALQTINKEAFYYIPSIEDRYDNEVHSDYLDVEYICKEAVEAMTDVLQDLGFMIGAPIKDVPHLRRQDANDYNRSTQSYSTLYSSSNLYKTQLKTIFDRVPTKAVYTTREVQEYSFWYGYYTTQKSEFDHYQIDDEARIQKMEYTISVPVDKKHLVMNELISSFDKTCTKVEEKKYSIDDNQIVLSEDATKILITMTENQ